MAGGKAMKQVGVVITLQNGKEVNIYFNSEEEMREVLLEFGYNVEQLYYH